MHRKSSTYHHKSTRKVRVKPKRKKFNFWRITIAFGAFLILAVVFGFKIFWTSRTNASINEPVIKPTIGWRLNKVADKHQIEGYVQQSSVIPGEVITFHISCQGHSFVTNFFRMGWYEGAGAKVISNLGSSSCREYKIPLPDRMTGLVAPNWPVTFRFRIPVNWQTGIYLAKLTNSQGYQSYVPFTVRPKNPKSVYLFVHSINTEEAYNHWGGNSLYSGFTPALKVHRAVEISLSRPFLQNDGTDDGSGDFFRWEYPMIKFIEKYGYQCDYMTDVDIHENPSILQKYKTVIIAGHDEYWSQQMIDGFKEAVAKGVNLAVFGANTAYRPIRYQLDPYTGASDGIIVNYKSAALDPMSGNRLGITVTPQNWRIPPLNQPETELLGIGYRNEVPKDKPNYANLVVSDARSWIFNGTGLRDGNSIKGIVGYEFDRYQPNFPHPEAIDIIFHSFLINNDGRGDFADSSYYKYPGGGGVFDGGTISWTSGLDETSPYYSPKLVQITRNILEHIGQNP